MYRPCMAPAHSRVSRNAVLWLDDKSHVTWILVSDWSSSVAHTRHESSLSHIRPLQAIDTRSGQFLCLLKVAICYLTKYPRHSVFFGQTGRWDFSRIENQEAYTLPEQKQNWLKCSQTSTWVIIVNNWCHFLLASLCARIQVFVFSEEWREAWMLEIRDGWDEDETCLHSIKQI